MIRSTLVLLLLWPAIALAQSGEQEISTFQKRYVTVGLGTGPGTIRDRATSPLFYNGSTFRFQLGFLRTTEQRETEGFLSYRRGAVVNSFGSISHPASLNVINLSYGRLFGVPALTRNKWNTMIGGRLITTATQRINLSLGNNALGIEAFFNLMASIKASRDISRVSEKTRKFLWMKRTLKPRTRMLDFRLDVGVINSNFRNGFIYAEQSGILNDPAPFSGHDFNFLSGLRFGTRLDYITYLENGNGLLIGYHWDALTSGEGNRSFDMALHTISIALLFHTKSTSR